MCTVRVYAKPLSLTGSATSDGTVGTVMVQGGYCFRLSSQDRSALIKRIDPSFLVDVRSSDFLDPSRNGDSLLKVHWCDLIWAAVTAGKWKADVFGVGSSAMYEAIHRAGCIYAYCVIRNNRLVMNDRFRNLDPSEKAIVSYYLGMAMSKIYSDRYLDVPWLMHISRYSERHSVEFLGRGRPDLFGMNGAGEWVVVEAKGRQRITPALIDTMRDQKSMVGHINGSQPIFRVGVAAALRSEGVGVVAVDPEPGADADRLLLSPARWLDQYYGPFVDLAREFDVQMSRESRVVQLPGTPVHIEVSNLIFSVVDDLRNRPVNRIGDEVSGSNFYETGGLGVEGFDDRIEIEKSIVAEFAQFNGGTASALQLKADGLAVSALYTG